MSERYSGHHGAPRGGGGPVLASAGRGLCEGMGIRSGSRQEGPLVESYKTTRYEAEQREEGRASDRGKSVSQSPGEGRGVRGPRSRQWDRVRDQ